MSKPLRVLMVEDAEEDAILLLHHLKRAGYAPESDRVDTRADTSTALDRQTWDVVISDYILPGFGGLELLAMVREKKLDVPVIIVSGAIGEDLAVEAMKAGAHDYVMKRNLARLAPSIEREMRDGEKRRAAQNALRHNEAIKSAILRSSLDSIITFDHEGKITDYNPAAERTFGYARSEALGKTMVDLIIPGEMREAYQRGMSRLFAVGGGEMLGRRAEISAQRRDGTEFPAEMAITRAEIEGPPIFTAYLRDISERRQAEEALRASERRFRHVVESNMIGIVFWEANGQITSANEAFLKTVGYEWRDMVGGRLNWRTLTPPEFEDTDTHALEELGTKDACTPFEKEYIRKDGSRVSVLIGAAVSAPRRDRGVAFVLDITARKQAETERTRLIHDLRDAIHKVKTLKGLLPICASCKKIRDDRGYWQKVELYISQHTDAEFTHGICPECAKTLYPDFVLKS